MKNVLLLCLSPLNSKAHMNPYSFTTIGGKTESLKGVMTNEAPTKAVIKLLDEKKDGGRLDEVVMICSDAVKKKIELNKESLTALEEINISKYMDNSHVELYQRFINIFAQDTNASYKEEPIRYEQVDIADFTEDNEVAKAVIEAAGKISDIGEEVNLYIDFNGGQRYVAFMILAIANLMKIRQVNIEQIMTMNFDNKIDGVVPIQNMKSVFTSFDLITGINEYVNYGRSKTLSNYFKPSNNDVIKKILEKMEEFSNNLQLCRTGYIMDQRGNLLKMLEDYKQVNEQKDNLDTYEQLFDYVVEDILEGYEGLLNGDLPDIIQWCVKNEFIQQALTFTSEELPGYFWRNEIFKATPAEEREYDHFLKAIHSLTERNSLKSVYRKKHSKNSSKYAYEWMICYLPNSSKSGYVSVLSNSNDSYKKLMLKNAPKESTREIKKDLSRFKRINMKGIDKSKNSMDKASGLAATLVYYTNQKNSRAFTKMTDKLLFYDVLVLYFLLKDQRNLTNHADGEADVTEAWSYGQLCRALNEMTEALKKDKKARRPKSQ